MCIRCVRRRLQWPTSTCCRTYCTARSARCGTTAGIRDREKRSGRRLPRAQDMTSRRVKYKNFVDELQKAKNRVKARVRAKVEHPFRILKRIFGFEKVRYRGLKKNHQRLCACFALVNLYLHRKRLAAA